MFFVRLKISPANGFRSEITDLAMHDEKRLLRELKRQVKKQGNRKRRRYLKDVAAEPDDFDFGRNRSEVMNEHAVRMPRQSRGISDGVSGDSDNDESLHQDPKTENQNSV